jgi:hypothetical protein
MLAGRTLNCRAASSAKLSYQLPVQVVIAPLLLSSAADAHLVGAEDLSIPTLNAVVTSFIQARLASVVVGPQQQRSCMSACRNQLHATLSKPMFLGSLHLSLGLHSVHAAM